MVLTPKRAIAAAPPKKKAAGGRSFRSTPPLPQSNRGKGKYRALVPQHKKFLPLRRNFFAARVTAKAPTSRHTQAERCTTTTQSERASLPLETCSKVDSAARAPYRRSRVTNQRW
jgi:hypothetical protein